MSSTRPTRAEYHAPPPPSLTSVHVFQLLTFAADRATTPQTVESIVHMARIADKSRIWSRLSRPRGWISRSLTVRGGVD